MSFLTEFVFQTQLCWVEIIHVKKNIFLKTDKRVTKDI